jgi:hypothetical protein
MNNEKCDMVHPNGVKEKKLQVIDGYTRLRALGIVKKSNLSEACLLDFMYN